MTLRKLYQMIEKDCPECLDAPLEIIVRDDHVNTASTRIGEDLWGYPRGDGKCGPEDEPYLHIVAHLNGHALRKEQKRQ